MAEEKTHHHGDTENSRSEGDLPRIYADKRRSEDKGSKTLDEINHYLKQTGFTEKFLPAGFSPARDAEVVSWYVMMESARW